MPRLNCSRISWNSRCSSFALRVRPVDPHPGVARPLVQDHRAEIDEESDVPGGRRAARRRRRGGDFGRPRGRGGRPACPGPPASPTGRGRLAAERRERAIAWALPGSCSCTRPKTAIAFSFAPARAKASPRERYAASSGSRSPERKASSTRFWWCRMVSGASRTSRSATSAASGQSSWRSQPSSASSSSFQPPDLLPAMQEPVGQLQVQLRIVGVVEDQALQLDDARLARGRDGRSGRSAGGAVGGAPAARPSGPRAPRSRTRPRAPTRADSSNPLRPIRSDRPGWYRATRPRRGRAVARPCLRAGPR